MARFSGRTYPQLLHDVRASVGAVGRWGLASAAVAVTVAVSRGPGDRPAPRLLLEGRARALGGPSSDL